MVIVTGESIPARLRPFTIHRSPFTSPSRRHPLACRARIVEDSPVPAAEHRFEITADEAHGRLDQFLVARLADLSRARIQALIKDAAITVNASVVKPGATF